MSERINEEMLKQFTGSIILTLQRCDLIKVNSWGVEVLVAERPGAASSFDELYLRVKFGRSLPEGKHDERWYIANAHGKNLVCLHTGMDSHEAVRTWQGTIDIEGAFPWGGAVIDTHYGVCIGVSGFREDEDLMVARAIRNFIVMHLDRAGQAWLDDARARGEDDAADPADRFTRDTSDHDNLGIPEDAE